MCRPHGARLWHNTLAVENLYSIPPLRMARIACELRPEGVITIPVEQRGNLLRGTFGALFRKLVCDPICNDVANCPRHGTCPHELLFAPKDQTGPRSRPNAPPRAYLFRPPLDPESCFSTSHPLRFELRLFGDGIATASLFLRTFQLMSQSRDPARRVHLDSAYTLDWNDAPCAELVRAGQLTGEQPQALDFSGFFNEEISPDGASIEFLSPMWLREKPAEPAGGERAPKIRPGICERQRERSQDLRVPTFPALIRHVRDRVSDLCRLYERKLWDPRGTDIEEAARRAERVDWDGRWTKFNRDSTRTDEEMPLQGFVGTISCRGIDPRLWPLLRIGQEVHAGREVVWGHGLYRARANKAGENCT